MQAINRFCWVQYFFIYEAKLQIRLISLIVNIKLFFDFYYITKKM